MNTFKLYNPVTTTCLKISLGTIFIILLFNYNITAQTNDNNFSTIKISISALQNRNSDPITRYWNMQTGIEGKVAMPFYGGNIMAGIRSIKFDGKVSEYYNFSAKYYFGGWEKDLKLIKSLNLFLGFKVGAFAMSFSDDSLSAFAKDETELSAGVNSGFHLLLFSNIFLNGSVEYSRIFTHKRIELFLVSAGLSYQFNTPEWMKDILK